MRKKIIIILGIGLLFGLIVLSAYYIFESKFAEFEVSIRKYESEQLENFQNQKEKVYVRFSSEGLEKFFNQYFEEEKSIIEKDTSFSFLFFSENLKFKIRRLEYFDCLYNKCIVEKKNELVLKLIKNKENELRRKYSSTFDIWYPKLKDKILVREIVKIEGCSDFYPELFENSFNEKAWKEFETFMTIYDNEMRLAESQNNKAETDYIQNVASVKENLNNSLIKYFNDKLADNKSRILSAEVETKTFKSVILGDITYDINRLKFNEQEFEYVADDVFKEQWKHHSLSTGSMPYSFCYGSDNYCSDWGCSEIKVITDGSADVLVSIKNSRGKVVRHAYIKRGGSFIFNVPNGRYQVFFYAGKGWNPYKPMPSSSCNFLRGGFVSDESVTKDDYIDIYNQMVVYELILTAYGNFRAKPSSKSEAF